MTRCDCHGNGFWEAKTSTVQNEFTDSIEDIAGLELHGLLEWHKTENWRRFCRGATADRLNNLRGHT